MHALGAHACSSASGGSQTENGANSLGSSEDLALILWFVEWDPIFLSLANPLPPLAIHPIVACRALRAVPHIAGRVGGKEKMTDARSVRFSLCWPRALSCCSCDRVLVIETSARFALLRLIRVGSEFGRRPCVHITHGRRTSSLALAPAPCHPYGIFYPLVKYGSSEVPRVFRVISTLPLEWGSAQNSQRQLASLEGAGEH